METDTDGTGDTMSSDVVTETTIEVPAGTSLDHIMSQYQLYTGTEADQLEHEKDGTEVGESHLLTDEETCVDTELVSGVGMSQCGGESVLNASDVIDASSNPLESHQVFGEIVTKSTKMSASPEMPQSSEKIVTESSKMSSSPEMPHSSEEIVTESSKSPSNPEMLQSSKEKATKPDVNLPKIEAVVDSIVDTDIHTVRKTPQEWCNELIKLCKQIESYGDECSVLYLNKQTGKKSYLHQLGTTKGKKFIKENGIIAKQFLSFCYGSPMKKIVSKDEEGGSNEISGKKRKPGPGDSYMATDSSKKAKLQDEMVGTDNNVDDGWLGGSTNERIDDDVIDDNEEEEDLQKGSSMPTLKRSTRSARQQLTTGKLRKGQYPCIECKFVAKHPLSLRKHILETHKSGKKKPKIQSPMTKETSTVKGRKQDHGTPTKMGELTISKTSGEKEYSRRDCDSVTRYPVTLKKHVKETHEEKTVSDKPNTLGKCVLNKETGDKEFQCRDCDFITNHAMTLRKHVRQNHEEAWNRWLNPSFTHEDIEEEDVNKEDKSEGVRGKRRSAILFKEKMLEQKLRSLEKKKFTCSICSRMFTQKQASVTHVIKHHPGNNPNKIIMSQDADKDAAALKQGPYKKKKMKDEEWSPKKIKKERIESEEEEEDKEIEDEEEESDEDEEYDDKEDESLPGIEENVHFCEQCKKSFKAASILRRHVLAEHPEKGEMKKSERFSSQVKKENTKEKNPTEDAVDDYLKERIESGEEQEIEIQPTEPVVERKSTRVSKTKKKQNEENNEEIKSSENEFITTDETNFYCYQCGNFFTCLKGLENHMANTKHTGNPLKRAKERKCVAIEHLSSKSKRRTEFRCSMCKKEYMKEKNCITHVQEGLCSPKYMQRCLECEKYFFSKNLYEAHLKEFKHSRDTNVKKSEEKENVLIIMDQPQSKPHKEDVPQTKCLECEKEFQTPEKFQSHVKITGHEQISTTETIYKCYTCMKYFVNEYALDSHMDHTKHTGNVERQKERKYVQVKCHKTGSKRERWFRCVCCASEFKLEANAKAHVAKGTCIPRFKRKCLVCNTHFGSNNKFQLHMKSGIHLRKDPVLRNVGPREDTQIPVETETIYKCFTCDKFYANLESLRLHMDATKHTGDSKKDGQREIEFFTEPNGVEKFRCSLCKIEFCYQENCIEHVQRASCKRKYKRKCPLCSVQFYSGFNLYQAHLWEKHSDEYPFKCEDCGKVFHHLAGFNCHRTQHKRGPYVSKAALESDAVLYPCDICGKMYTDKANMKRHKDLHGRGREFTCEICGKSYKRKDFLKFHIKYNHGGKSNPNDPHCVCDICGKVMATPKSKYSHMKMAHSDEKPFCCEICGHRSKQLGNLKYHHAIHHSNEKPFECQECGRRFQIRQLLKKHMANHLLKRGSVAEAAKLTKMYTCPDCGKSFVGKSSYESHRLMHFECELKCALCNSRMRRRATLRRHYSRVHKFSTEEVDELTKNIPMDKDLIPVDQKGRVKVEVMEGAREDNSDTGSDMEIVTGETLLLQQNTAPVSQKGEKTLSKPRDFVQEAQAQVSLLTSTESTSSTLPFDPNQVEFEEVSVPEQFVALSETVSTETTSSSAQAGESESQQIILDGPLADMLHEKVIRAVVNPDGSISIHIQE